jgi:hypothetical protein
MKSKPVLFVGSSTEGLQIAQTLQVLLEYSCEVEVWSQGTFGLSQGGLEALVLALDRFDFAVLVLTADDLVTKRDKTVVAPRDNVLFEFGLFIGAIGRERTYMLYDRSKPPELPTDLAGITPATFEPHSSGNLEAALGAASTRISRYIQRLGPRERRDISRVDYFNLGVNLGWLHQGSKFGGRPISFMAADLERVRAARYTDNEATALITRAQVELQSGQRTESILDGISNLITLFLSQSEGKAEAALNLGIVLGCLQQGAIANNLPSSLATSNLESARVHASMAGYHSYNGFLDNAFTKLSSGHPVSSISPEITHLMGLFQGQC